MKLVNYFIFVNRCILFRYVAEVVEEKKEIGIGVVIGGVEVKTLG